MIRLYFMALFQSSVTCKNHNKPIAIIKKMQKNDLLFMRKYF